MQLQFDTPIDRRPLLTKLAHGRSLLWGLAEFVALLRARRRARLN